MTDSIEKRLENLLATAEREVQTGFRAAAAQAAPAGSMGSIRPRPLASRPPSIPAACAMRPKPTRKSAGMATTSSAAWWRTASMRTPWRSGPSAWRRAHSSACWRLTIPTTCGTPLSREQANDQADHPNASDPDRPEGHALRCGGRAASPATRDHHQLRHRPDRQHHRHLWVGCSDMAKILRNEARAPV